MHRANIGPTGCGKTYQALCEAKRAGGPVLFVNVKDDYVGSEYIRVTGEDEKRDFERLLKRGEKVNYVPSRDRKIALRELDIVIRAVFDVGNVFVIFDETEVHGYEGLSFSPLFDVAERGRSRGIQGLFLVQDPAGVSKRILRQCEQFRVFAFNEYSGAYFTRLGYDVQKMQNMLFQAGKYSYILIEGGQIVGIRKEGKNA